MHLHNQLAWNTRVFYRVTASTLQLDNTPSGNARYMQLGWHVQLDMRYMWHMTVT
jgi:hypothetical protein